MREIEPGADAPTFHSVGNARPIFLDHHSTTPVDARVAQVVLHAMTEAIGNPNSLEHVYGEEALALVVRARHLVSELVGADPDDVHFTSGSTEAIRLAVNAAISVVRGKTPHLALTRVEHRAVLDSVEEARQQGARVSWIEVDRSARIVDGSLEHVLAAGVDLVCVMAANNEVGTVYPIAELAARIHASGAAILVDGTQAAGRLELNARRWHLDYLAVSGHKMYGPKGVGALITPSGDATARMAFVGHAGTPNVPGIAGFGEACRLRRLEMAEDEHRISAMRDALESALTATLPNLVVNGDREGRLANSLHISVPGVPNEAVVARLRRKVAISTGAACMSGAQTPSHVLVAMGLSRDAQEGALRIGLGKFNTPAEIDRAGREIASAVLDAQDALCENGRL